MKSRRANHCWRVASLLIASGLVAVRAGLGEPADLRPTSAGSIAQELQNTLVSVIERAEPCVVAISRGSANDQASRAAADPFSGFGSIEFHPRTGDLFQPSGAGVVIDLSGLVLTQYLNVRSGHQHLVTTTDGRRLTATIKAADPRSGLAVLEAKGLDLPAIELGDGDAVQKGYLVVTIGNPQSIIANGEATASWGTVTNLAQRVAPTTNLNNTRDETGLTYATTLHHLGTLLQTDAKLNWKYGGGAVVDLSGRLIGITTTAGTLPGHESPAGYAVPMTSVFRRVVDDLKAGREVEYGLLGLRLKDPERSSPSQIPGAVVSLTVPGGAAQRAGIRNDDRLVEVDGKPIETVTDLQLIVGSLPPGRPVNVGLIRGNQQIELPVSLSKLHVRGEKLYTEPRQAWRGIQVDYCTALSLDEIQQAASAALIDPDGCVVVTAVEPNSPADVAGIEPGMFISHVGSQRVSTPKDFFAAAVDGDETINLRFTSANPIGAEPDNLVERDVAVPSDDRP